VLLSKSVMQLAPVLLAAGTHCWHQLCKWSDKSNSTGIRMALLKWFESIIFSSSA